MVRSADNYSTEYIFRKMDCRKIVRCREIVRESIQLFSFTILLFMLIKYKFGACIYDLITRSRTSTTRDITIMVSNEYISRKYLNIVSMKLMFF